jgi:GYF domain 2
MESKETGMSWHVMADGQKFGPVSLEDPLSWARAGRLKAIDLVWREGAAVASSQPCA